MTVTMGDLADGMPVLFIPSSSLIGGNEQTR